LRPFRFALFFVSFRVKGINNIYTHKAQRQKSLKIIYTFAAMKKQLTHLEAWNDFFAWIKTQPQWKEIPRSKKQYFYMIKKRVNDKAPPNAWIEGALKKYAPERYEFVILKKDETPINVV